MDSSPLAVAVSETLQVQAAAEEIDVESLSLKEARERLKAAYGKLRQVEEELASGKAQDEAGS